MKKTESKSEKIVNKKFEINNSDNNSSNNKNNLKGNNDSSLNNEVNILQKEIEKKENISNFNNVNVFNEKEVIISFNSFI